MNHPTLQSVTDWTYEHSENHSRPVPIMDREERDAWVELNHAPAHTLTPYQRGMLSALNRKLNYRARFER